MGLAHDLPLYTNDVSRTLVTFFREQHKEAFAIHPTLLESLRQLEIFSLRGGKAIRSYLVKLGYDIAGGKPHVGLVKVAAAIDLHHKHILILDDIADRDEERYGGPTVEYAYHTVFTGNKEKEHRARTFAMLDAVWLGALAKELLLTSHFDAERLLAVIHILDTLMYRDTLAGWQIHALECDASLDNVTIDEFVKGLELVTARYTFEGPLKIGLTLAGNKDKQLETALTTYSQKVGTAFQIHDDILGLFGDTEKTGKSVGNDVREGKKTLLVQVAYEHANEDGKKFLQRTVGDPHLTHDDILRVQTIVNTTGSLAHSQDLEKVMVSQGVKALDILPNSPEKNTLVELAHFIIAREK